MNSHILTRANTAPSNLLYALTLAAIPLITVGASQRAFAAETPSLVVTTTDDISNDSDGLTSLREAIVYANSDTAGADPAITFAPDVAGSIALKQGELVIDHNLTITGPTNGIIVDARNNGRVFNIGSGTVGLSKLTITGGNSDFNSTSNSNRYGGGGGIYNNGTLTVTDSTVSGNSASYGGFGSDGGGGIYNDGTLTVTSSTVSGNSAFYGGGGIYNNGTLTVTDSTVSGNSASYDDGGGIYNRSGTLTLTNSTVSGNSARYDGGGIFSFGSLIMTSSTVSGNSAFYVSGVYSGGTTILKSTLVVGNGDSNGNNNNDFIGNLSGDSSNNITTGTAAEAGLDPDGLKDNGGPTQTIALTTNGTAVDAGSNPAELDTDQRGVGFTRIKGGGAADIGAYESDFTANRAPVAMPQDLGTNEDISLSGTLAGTDADEDSLTFALASNASHGAVIVNSDGTFTYTPEANYNGSDSFSFVASDGTLDSAAVTVTIKVTAVNDAPSFAIGENQSIDENAGSQTVTGFAGKISAGPADEQNQKLNFEVTTDNPELFAVAPIIGREGRLLYRVKDNAAGIATVTVALKDNGGVENDGKDTSEAQSFTISIAPKPLFLSVSLTPLKPFTNTVVRAETVLSQTAGVTLNYDWFVNNKLVQSGERSKLNLGKAGNGDKGDRVSVVVTASKPGTSASASKRVFVGNSEPRAFGGRAQTESGVQIVIPMLSTGGPGASDLDSDLSQLSFRRVGDLSGGFGRFIKAADGSTSFYYKSDADFVGTETVRFVVFDDEGSVSNLATLKINVTANSESVDSASASASASASSHGAAPSGGNS